MIWVEVQLHQHVLPMWGLDERQLHWYFDYLFITICLLTSNRTCWGNATGVPRQKAFTSKARGWFYWYNSLVYFLNMPSVINKLHPFCTEQVRNILKTSMYQYFFWTFFKYRGTQFLDNVIINEINIPIFFFGTFFEYQGTQFLDNVICHSHEILKWMLLNRGISIFLQTLLGIQTSLHQMQLLLTYLESDTKVTYF